MSAITPPPVYKRDYAFVEFALVLVGSLALAAGLSYSSPNSLLSVGFCALAMLLLSIHRYRVASAANRDAESLEVFAEDIYLLGYLLTLASLLGLIPRLTADDSNLINIAGLKLTTTVLGLALMMLFKLESRRWAAERLTTKANEFEEQQKRFIAAVATLNDAADVMTGKLAEIMSRFDPNAITSIIEWSNQAATAFGAAIEALGQVPHLVNSGQQRIDQLGESLARAQSAAEGLSGALTVGPVEAARQLTANLGHANQAVMQLRTSITTINPASETATRALATLGDRIEADKGSFGEMTERMKDAVAELGKVHRSLKRTAELQSADADSPMVRLLQALETSAGNSNALVARFESIQTELTRVASASDGMGRRIETNLGSPILRLIQAVETSVGNANTVLARFDPIQSELGRVAKANEEVGRQIVKSVGTPLTEQGQSLERLQQQVLRVADQLQLATGRFEAVANALQADAPNRANVLTALAKLEGEMNQTNAQFKLLLAKIDGGTGGANPPGFVPRWFGGR